MTGGRCARGCVIGEGCAETTREAVWGEAVWAHAKYRPATRPGTGTVVRYLFHLEHGNIELAESDGDSPEQIRAELSPDTPQSKLLQTLTEGRWTPRSIDTQGRLNNQPPITMGNGRRLLREHVGYVGAVAMFGSNATTSRDPSSFRSDGPCSSAYEPFTEHSAPRPVLTPEPRAWCTGWAAAAGGPRWRRCGVRRRSASTLRTARRRGAAARTRTCARCAPRPAHTDRSAHRPLRSTEHTTVRVWSAGGTARSNDYPTL